MNISIFSGFRPKTLFSAVILSCSLSPCNAYAQQLGGGATPDISFWRILIAFIVSLGLGLLVLFILRARNNSYKNIKFKDLLNLKAEQSARDITIIDRCRLGPQSEIIKLRSGDREYLVLSGASHSTLLDSHAAKEQDDEAGEAGLP